MKAVLSILIPSRNRADEMATTLQALDQTELLRDCPIFIYDDASDDPTAYAAFASSATIFRGNVRGGQTKGRNRLLSVCDTPLALLLDDDVRPLDIESLQAVMQMMLDDSSLAVVSPTIIDKSKLHAHRRDSTTHTKGDEVTSFCAAAFLARPESLLRVGGFRELLVYGFEEPELSLRIIGNGYRILSAPSLWFLHDHTQSARDHNEYAVFYARNQILMYALNLPWGVGLIYGMLKSGWWCLRRGINRPSEAQALGKGFCRGCIDFYRHRSEHTSLDWKTAIKVLGHRS